MGSTNKAGCSWAQCQTSSFLNFSAQLGLSQAGYVVGNAAFGEGTGPILWDNVVCTGNEKTIQECSRSPTIDCRSSKIPSRHAVLWCNFTGMHTNALLIIPTTSCMQAHTVKMWA